MIVTIDRHGVWTTRCPSTPHTLATCAYKRPCECRYIEGKEPPHFPVPAIRERSWYEVMIEWHDLQYSAAKAYEQSEIGDRQCIE